LYVLAHIMACVRDCANPCHILRPVQRTARCDDHAVLRYMCVHATRTPVAWTRDSIPSAAECRPVRVEPTAGYIGLGLPNVIREEFFSRREATQQRLEVASARAKHVQDQKPGTVYSGELACLAIAVCKCFLALGPCCPCAFITAARARVANACFREGTLC
jgi:hypothetical protein